MKRTGREELSRLLGIASHDLRSPLAAIAAHSDNLLDGVHGQVQSGAKEPIRKIRRIAADASARVEEILSLAGPADPAPCLDPREVIRQAVASGRLQTRPRGVKVAVRLPRGLPGLAVAKVLLKLAVKNLLDNALRASPPRGRVSVEAAREAGTLRIEVKDRGRRGSHPWRRGNQEEGYEGEGLGLRVVREMVEEQGGKVFASPRRGGGWVAGFLLPARPGAEKTKAPRRPRTRRR